MSPVTSLACRVELAGDRTSKGSRVLSPAVKRASIAPALIGCGGVVRTTEPETRGKVVPGTKVSSWRPVWLSDAAEEFASPLAPGNRPYKESKLQFSW